MRSKIAAVLGAAILGCPFTSSGECVPVNHPPVLAPLTGFTFVIGDLEGGAENNYFVFENALRFDDYVSDVDTTVSELMWSFDEGDDPGTPGSATQWFRINGMDPVHVGSAEQGIVGPGENPHLFPAQNLRAAGEFASVRDIVFSPGEGALTSPFPDPVDPERGSHEIGKVVKFYVSDGTSVVSTRLRIRVVDNSDDSVWVPDATWYSVINDFVTGPEEWIPAAPDSSEVATSYSSADGSLRVHVTHGLHTNRLSGWLEPYGRRGMTFGAIGDGYARAKFHIYAGGQQGSDSNQIPNLRLRAGALWAANSILDIYHHSTSDRQVDAMARDLRPSTDPQFPSVYQVLFDPPNVPYVLENSTGTVWRMFESYSTANEPQENGYLAMTESSIETFDFPDSDEPCVLLKTYASAEDFSSSFWYQTMQFQRGSLFPLKANANGSTVTVQQWTFPLLGPEEASVTTGPGGVTLDTTGSTNTVIAIASADFLQGNAEDVDYTKRVRVEEDAVYQIRFHATSTVPASRNSMIRFRARTCKFQYTQHLDVGGALALNNGSGSDIIAQQYLPGTGTRNLDRRHDDTSGGFYNLLVASPVSLGIRAESTGTVEQRMPLFATQPGPGENAPSRRDLNVGVDLIDSISGAYWQSGTSDQESGQVTVDRIEIRKHRLGRQ